MASTYIAVLDIGKTNKKILVYDQALKVVDSVYKSFEETVEGDIHFESVEPVMDWFVTELKKFSSQYTIKALSITTHGATAMAVDKEGNLAVPPVAYTTEAGEEFGDEFYATFGSKEDLQAQTATAEIGSLINVGKKVFFWKKRYPEQFENIHQILNYPQYFGYKFTGNYGAEPTYVGCHSYLFDPVHKQYSSVAEKLGIVDKLPQSIKPSWEVLGTISPAMQTETGLSSDCIVTMGIHDSNASLLPYLIKGYEDLVLNSTGTWCVAMHPTKDIHFEKNELGKLVFFNLSAFFNPVKTSIFMGGLEFETYTTLLKDLTRNEDYPPFDAALYQKIISEKELFILPSVVKGTGLFPDAQPKVVEKGTTVTLTDIKDGGETPAFFNDYETAYAVLNISLAIQTKVALDMAGFDGAGDIFTEGGFRNNDPYNRLLTALYPQSKAVLTQLQEATAFGAALLGKAALDKKSPMELGDLYAIETTPVEQTTLKGMQDYVKQFLSFL